jgi:large subunit ribosomal protein L24
MKKLKKGDAVIVMAGRDKGRRGTVIEVLDNDMVIVENVNRVKKHQKGNPQTGTPAGIIEKAAPLHVSKVAILNPATQKADRIGFKTLADGKKVRFFKSNGEMLEV